MEDTRDFSIGPSKLPELFKNRSLRSEEKLENIKTFGGIEGLCSHLQTDLINGINDDSVKISKRANHFGTNIVSQKLQKLSLFECLKDQLTDYIFLLILSFSSVSIVIGVFAGTSDYMGNFKILISLWILYAVYAVFEYQKAKKLNTLKPLNWDTKVIRNGAEKIIFRNDLLVGDLLIISKGDVLQADGVLIRGSILQVKENNEQLSSKIPILGKENSSDPFVNFGTKVCEGDGVVLVLSFENYSPETIKDSDEEKSSLLEDKILEKAASWGKIGVISSIIVILTLLIIFFYHSIVEWKWGAAGTIEVFSIFIVGFTLILATVPENFSVFITTYFSHAIRQISKEKIFIKNFDQIEIIGEITAMIISINSLNENTKSLKNLTQKLQNSGVEIKIVTEKDEKTGTEIAESYGISGDNSVMDAEVLKRKVPGFFGILEIDKEDPRAYYIIRSFKNATENIKVFVNCSANDKALIAKAYKFSGEIIGSVETCQLDSLLLENSDVGVSASTNSQICMAASSIILPGSDYETFINVRKISKNCVLASQKLIVLQESFIFVLISICLIGIFTSGKLLFNGVQLIWICFMVDILGTLIFTINIPNNNELDMTPLKASDEIVNRDMKITIRTQIIYQALILVFLYLGNQSSLVFHTFVLMKIFNELNLVNLSFKNIQAIIIVVLSLIIHYFALEYAGSCLDCQNLSWEDHFYCIKLAAGSLFASFISKFLFKLSKKKLE